MGYRAVRKRLLWLLMFLVGCLLSFVIIRAFIDLAATGRYFLSTLIALLGFLALNQIALGFSVLIYQSREDLVRFVTAPSTVSLLIMLAAAPAAILITLECSLFNLRCNILAASYLAVVFIIAILIALAGRGRS